MHFMLEVSIHNSIPVRWLIVTIVKQPISPSDDQVTLIKVQGHQLWYTYVKFDARKFAPHNV